jgi:PAS domain S-box-containing protein
LETGLSKAFTVQHPLRGEMRWLDGIVTPVRSGEDGEAYDLIVASVRDVTHERALTDQIAAQAQVAAEAAEREAVFFQHAPGVMTVVGVREQNGEMQFACEAVSPSFEAAIGWRAADLIGKSSTVWMQPGLAQQILARYRQCVETGEPVSWNGVFETRQGRFNGEGIVTPALDRVTGKVTRLIVMIRDVDERSRTLALIEPDAP